MSAKWIESLKIALINEDIETMALLYAEIPTEYESLDQAKEAAALMAGVIGLLKEKREQLQVEMDQTKKAMVYQQNQLGAKPARVSNLG